MFIDDTIAAIATAPGEGGIGIIRISGSKALTVAEEIFKSVSGKKITDYNTRTLIYGHILDGDNKIDEVLLAFMKGPNSYTAEDVIEINCHGGFISVKKILELILSKDVRLAEEGEFTKRAFLNGRIDLSQAEAVIDVIKAKTDKAQEVAQSHLSGSLANKIKELRFKVTEVLAHLEVSIDFAEEDVEEITYAMLEDNANALRAEIKSLYDSAECGKVLRDGLKTVIVGKPNVGKSSLLNYILGENRAIVTEIAGTTRDVIEEFVNIKGIPLKIVDTAGIRETEDIVEKIGVEKSKEQINKADIILCVLDGSEPINEQDKEILNEIKNKCHLTIINKIDLEQKINLGEVDDNVLFISTKNNNTIKELENKILETLNLNNLFNKDITYISNARQLEKINFAIKALDEALTTIENEATIDFVDIDIRKAWLYLGEIVGQTSTDNLLDELFSKFCLGK